ncbi:protein DpdI [Thalassotalea ponticola]|uniref:protein DpdI n=1 Tax=Thalassotalea ponticola TaxID=1523392 RepID=UPI0025B57754|nr:protein DpdI [Thalassotalea ponticola]MDN3652327.1 protein DpdI [Thalassotalea ponticola]
MSLKSQIEELRKEIDYYHDSENLENKKEALKTISRRLHQSSNNIEIEVRKHECLQKVASLPLSGDTARDALIQSQAKLRAYKDLWNNKEEGSLTDEENTLFSLTESVKHTAKIYSDYHQGTWNEWSNNQKNIANVDTLILEQQKSVHGNFELYKQYNEAKRQFDLYIENFDFDINKITLIQALAKKCSEFKGHMNTENLPEDVKKLFDTLNTVGRIAYVSLLTPEVMDWLEKNNKLDTLIIRQK